MNSWASFSDCSEADDCISIQTFCFSLLVICRTETVMRAISCEVVCTYAVFFLYTLPLVFFEMYNLAGHKSIKSLQYFPKRKYFMSENQKKESWEAPRTVQWLKQSFSSHVVVSLSPSNSTFTYKSCQIKHHTFSTR